MKKFLLSFIWLLISINLFSENLSTCVRAMGMGNAYIAIANDASGISYNPAGILQNSSVMINLSGVNYYSIKDFSTYSISAKWRNLGVRYYYLKTPVLINKQDFEVAYAYPIGSRVGIGINYRILRTSYNKDDYGYSDVEVLNAYNNYSLSIGLISSPVENFSFGLIFSNGINKFAIKNFAFGIGYRFSPTFIAAMDIKFKQLLEDDYDIYSYIGIEKNISSNIIFRIGLYETKITFGVGLIYKYFTLDYAFVGNDEIDNTQAISISFSF